MDSTAKGEIIREPIKYNYTDKDNDNYKEKYNYADKDKYSDKDKDKDQMERIARGEIKRD